MQEKMMIKKGLLAVAACGLAFSLPAAAGNNPFAQDEATLRLDGIDLSTADGQQRLAIRMDQVAQSVCGDRMSSVHLALAERARDCRQAVAADVRAQIEARTAEAVKTSRTQIASGS